MNREQIEEHLQALKQPVQEANARALKSFKSPDAGLRQVIRAMKYFQRSNMCAIFWLELPKVIGPFSLQADLVPRGRIVYKNHDGSVELIFRRMGSIGSFSSQKRDALYPHPTLFDVETGQVDDGKPQQVAIIWQLSEFDSNFEQTGPAYCVARIARPGTSVEDGEWDGPAINLTSDEFLIPSTANFDPNSVGIESEEEESG